MSKSALPVMLPAIVCTALLSAGRLQATAVGDTAPEVHATDWINSGPLSLAGSKGHIVVVEFWATW